MAIKFSHSNSYSLYFCTFTCFNWLPLIELTKSHDVVYNWFEVLRNHAVDVIGYVVMPNHIHVIIHFQKENFNLNKVIGNTKRFMAYEIVNRLETAKDMNTLTYLHEALTERKKKQGQLHKVFAASFDAKPIFSDKFLDQKLNYIHYNPVSGKSKLVNIYTDYEHSSASFYEFGIQKQFRPVHYKDL